MKLKHLLVVSTILFLILSCTKNGHEKSPPKKTVWLYSSLWDGTIEELNDRLAEEFPELEFKWFRAGSEEIAEKVDNQIISDGEIQADVMITTSRIWYEDLALKGYLSPLESTVTEAIPEELKHPRRLYNTFSIPVMVLVYNGERVSHEMRPESFLDLSNEKWKGKLTTGNPLSSGTNFTTMAMLQHHYGWKYFKALRKNNVISQGGNGEVYKRLSSNERDVGWLLLDIMLRYKDEEKVLKFIYPKDGVVIQNNILALSKKAGNRKHVQKVAEWFFKKKAQDIMVNSYMYSPFPDYDPPKGGLPLTTLLKNSFRWDRDLLEKILKNRDLLKSRFIDIVLK